MVSFEPTMMTSPGRGSAARAASGVARSRRDASAVRQAARRLKLRRAGEREAADPKRWNMGASYLILEHHRLAADRLDVRERVEHALCEAKVVHRAGDLAVLDEERAVAGHARQDRLRGLHNIHVVEARYPQAA